MNSDYGAQNYGTTASSGVPGWVWLIVFVVLLFIAFFVWRAVRKYIIRKNQINLTADWVMFKVMVPRERHAIDDDQKKNFQEMMAVIEPFYANLNSIFDFALQRKMTGQDHISLEIIAKNNLINFYIGCPSKLAETIVKNLQSQYSHSEVVTDNDYSIFPDKPLSIAIAKTKLLKHYIFPLKTYKYLEEDPLNAITNSLSKLNQDESAAIQLLIRPTNGMWRIASEKAAYNIQHGKYKTTSNSKMLRATDSFFNFVGSAAATAKGKEEKTDINTNFLKLTPMQENQIKFLGEKSAKTGFECQLRVVTVAETEEKAKQNLREICSAYSQFNTPETNGLVVKNSSNKAEEIANYIFRIFGDGQRMILNTEELSSIYHLPNRFIETPNISWLLAKKEAPPSNLPTEGTIIGNSVYRGRIKPVRIQQVDRMRHIYMIGKTGVGKTVLFQNMILQDIKEGRGVCYLDPNGDAAEWILNHIPKERAEDVVYFDPSDIDRPFGLNMLEWKTVEQRDFLVQETIQIFYKLFDPNQTGMVGPQFEHWMRNAALTLMAHPDGGTVIDIPRLFTDPEFEKDRTKYVTDPVVKSFWEKQMVKTADFHKSEMLNYFTSKFGRFMTNDMIRNIIGQTKSSFDFREIMDSKKILICNLSKGKVGEINAFLLGMIIVSKIAMGAFSRQDIPEEKRIPFFLYVDEFQNFITDVFATILSESRKYKLSLNITNQYIAQMDDKTREAVIGNAGTLVAFRVGAADAEYLVKEFDPLKVDDMINIDKFNFYIKMLIDGAPSKPFNAQSIWPDQNEGNIQLGAAIKELSRLKYGRPRELVSAEILERSRVDSIDLPGISPTDAQKTL